MDEVHQLFIEGKQAFQRRQFDKAQKAFAALMEQKQPYADVYNMMGVIHHQFGQFSQAVGYFEQAIKLNSKYVEALLNLAVLYNDLGEYKKGRKLYNKVQALTKATGKGGKMDPFIRGKLANRHADLGDLYDGIGLYKDAVEEYKKALSLAPTFHDIRCKLAGALREQRQFADALREYRKVIKANPKYLYAKVQLGLTQHAKGQVKEATKTWQEVLKKDPDYEAAARYLDLVKEA